MTEKWQCDRCGHVEIPEKGCMILAEFICTRGLRKDGQGACGGLVREVPQADGGVNSG